MKKQLFYLTLLEKLHAMIYSEDYKETARVHPSDFTRRRKMSFVQYILFILQRTGRSLQAALNMFALAMKEDPGDYSRQAFSKGRLRIKPEAIRQLFAFIVQEFYAHTKFLTYEGYRVLAIDGTKLNLPNTAELRQEFGAQKTKGAEQVQALVSGLYDVLNKVMVDVCISSCTTNERAHAAELIHGLQAKSVQKNLILMDRGYPSAALLRKIQEEGHAYIVRCSSEFIKAMKLDGNDCIIEHQFASMRDHPVRLRIVKVRISENTEEILATNLFSKEFTAEKLANIYRMRWGIETGYDCLKNKLCVERFTGTNKIVILQDFYATIFLWDLAGILAFELKDEIEEAHLSAENENTYQLNMTMTISTLKERVVELVMCESKRKSRRILCQIYKALHRSVVTSKPNRCFPRKRKHPSLKFHNTSKLI